MIFIILLIAYAVGAFFFIKDRNKLIITSIIVCVPLLILLLTKGS